MFDDIGDDELEVQTEMSDEQRDDRQLEEDQRKPGPLQVQYYTITLCDCVADWVFTVDDT